MATDPHRSPSPRGADSHLPPHVAAGLTGGLQVYEIYSITDAGEHLEARRTGLRAAFAVARKLWREYREAAVISVRIDGVEIERDVTQMYLSRRKWHFGWRRGLPT